MTDKLKTELNIAEVLSKLTTYPEWIEFERLLDMHISGTMRKAFRDKERPREYWEGAVDALENLMSQVRLAVEVHRERADSIVEVKKRVAFGPVGGGLIAVAPNREN